MPCDLNDFHVLVQPKRQLSFWVNGTYCFILEGKEKASAGCNR